MEIPTPCFTTQRYPRQQEKNIFQHSKAFCCFRFPSSLDGESNASGIEVESDDGEKNLKRKRKYRIFPSASFHLVFTLISTFKCSSIGYFSIRRHRPLASLHRRWTRNYGTFKKGLPGTAIPKRRKKNISTHLFLINIKWNNITKMKKKCLCP